MGLPRPGEDATAVDGEAEPRRILIGTMLDPDVHAADRFRIDREAAMASQSDGGPLPQVRGPVMWPEARN